MQPDNRVMDLVDQVRRAMAPELKAMDDLADALRDFESFFLLEGLHNDAKDLANAGWMFPLTLTPGETHSLAQLARENEREAVDQRFLDRFTVEGEDFDRLVLVLTRSPRLSAWGDVLSDCVWAYKQGRYSLVIPAALLVLEGVVAELTERVQKRDTNPSWVWQNATYKPADDRLMSIFCVSTATFLSGLWQRWEFDQAPPEAPNRHWILHGRLPQFNTKANALRLMVAITCVAQNWHDFAPTQPSPPRSTGKTPGESS